MNRSQAEVVSRQMHRLTRPHPADEARLRALEAVAEAARFHNKTPTGQTRACLDGCIACAALHDLDAAIEGAREMSRHIFDIDHMSMEDD